MGEGGGDHIILTLEVVMGNEDNIESNNKGD